MCCRVIYKLRKYCHILQHLVDLHWLKIEQQIEFKVAVMVYSCVKNKTLSYLVDLIQKVKVKTNHKLHSP